MQRLFRSRSKGELDLIDDFKPVQKGTNSPKISPNTSPRKHRPSPDVEKKKRKASPFAFIGSMFEMNSHEHDDDAVDKLKDLKTPTTPKSPIPSNPSTPPGPKVKIGGHFLDIAQKQKESRKKIPKLQERRTGLESLPGIIDAMETEFTCTDLGSGDPSDDEEDEELDHPDILCNMKRK
jgi:hypothetical protein